QRGDTAFLIEVITDGGENASTLYNQSKINNLLKECDKQDNWTIVFQVPVGNKNIIRNQFSVPEYNIVEWENTSAGTERATQATTKGLFGYMNARSLGQKKVDTFYQDLDLKNLNISKVKRELTDLSRKFKLLDVDKQSNIKEFVEKKMKIDYKIGQGKYELVKPELVQDYKEIYVMVRGENKIYGGEEARDLLNLPDGNVKINPMNLSNFRIFVESRSHNRILPLGSKILVEVNFAKERNPVWTQN
ncbi:MAG TPA: hypothetical protein VFV86_12925, partial [Nitrososphaeraceae archaeon]|nr:hypothetical protein [Nitrososphaeraceae archaeon]